MYAFLPITCLLQIMDRTVTNWIRTDMCSSKQRTQLLKTPAKNKSYGRK